jgi:Family of unknown function (DUF6515)
MKIYMISALVALMFISGLTVSAQYGRHYGRYNSRSYHYNRFPSRSSVSIMAGLPFGAVSLTFGNRYYHYYNGAYYRPYDRGYRIVEPPIGIIVPSLPIGYSNVIIGSSPYYRYGNVFYAPYGNRYKVVEQPEEPETSTASNDKADKSTNSEYEKVVLEGKTYYKKGDKYYKASVTKGGEITYEEVGETSKLK